MLHYQKIDVDNVNTYSAKFSVKKHGGHNH